MVSPSKIYLALRCSAAGRTMLSLLTPNILLETTKHALPAIYFYNDAQEDANASGDTCNPASGIKVVHPRVRSIRTFLCKIII